MDYLEKKYKDRQIDIKTINIIAERDEFIENNSKNICVEYVNEELFNEILKQRKVISYQQENESICVKYIDEKNSSVGKNITLQDAYMNFLGE